MSRKDEIHLSQKHGVNPMVTLCFYCQESTGIALLGRLKHDDQAPRQGTLDMEPCTKCAGHMEQGVILISVRDGEECENPYRTGGWIVVREEAIAEMFTPPELVTQVLERRFAYVPDEVWEVLGIPQLLAAKEELS